MKKIICLACVLMLCLSMSLTVFAATAEFVPSIAGKDGPGFSFAFMGEVNVGDCLVITSIKQAQDKSTDITQETRDKLLDVYAKLSDGSMTLPIDEDYVIRELVDVNYKYEACGTQDDHGDKLKKLNDTDETLTVKFDLGISASTKVIVMTYKEGKWEDIKSVVNNGDGTVTCEFESLCPVAFAVKQSTTDVTPPQTGDQFGQFMPLWISLTVLSGAALAFLAVTAAKKKEQ